MSMIYTVVSLEEEENPWPNVQNTGANAPMHVGGQRPCAPVIHDDEPTCLAYDEPIAGIITVGNADAGQMSSDEVFWSLCGKLSPDGRTETALWWASEPPRG